MRRAKKDRKREDRIVMEIIVDAYGPEEQAMGWYYYLQDKLAFPFVAHCISERAISPLCKGDEVEIIDMAHEEEKLTHPLRARQDGFGSYCPLLSLSAAATKPVLPSY